MATMAVTITILGMFRVFDIAFYMCTFQEEYFLIAVNA